MSRAKPLALVALLFAVTVECLRATGPLLDTVAGQVGTVVAAGAAVGLFLLPGALLVTLRRFSLPVVVALLLVVRLTAQFVAELPVTGAAAVLAMTALGLAVQRAADPVTAVCGVLVGGGLDLAIRAMTISWDPIWFGVAGLPMAASVLVVLWLTLAVPSPERGTPLLGRVWTLGAYLALWTTTIGNPAFVASQSGVELIPTLLVLMAGLALAAEIVRRMRLHGGSGTIPEPDAWFAGLGAGVALVALIALAWWNTGPPVLIAAVAATTCAAVALARAIAAPGGHGTWAYGLIWVLPVLLFQVHYDLPLPFDNRLVLLLPAVLLTLAAAGRRPWAPGTSLTGTSLTGSSLTGSWPAGAWPAGSLSTRSLSAASLSAASSSAGARPAGPVSAASQGPLSFGSGRFGRSTGSPLRGAAQAIAVLLLVPLVVLVTPPSTSDLVPADSSIRLMSWNVKYGRDDLTGRADPRQIAAAVRDARADVVVLQEVSRGWAIGGGVDVAEYLSRELGMAYRWGPAADGQFGNLLLTNRPLRNVRVGELPFGQGPMRRSYLFATVGVGSKSVDLVTTHLTHKKQNTPTRLDQIDSVLLQRPTLVAGDLNFWPSWAEQTLFTRAGYVSAQDFTGNGPLWTSPGADPTNRVDWIFGTPQVVFSGFEILGSVTVSDHLPLLVTVSLT